MSHRHFRGIVKKRGAEKGGLSAERFGGTTLDDLLILFFLTVATARESS